MNYKFLVLALLATLSLTVNGFNRDPGERINMHYPGHHGTHHDVPMLADEPDVYYDSEAQEIIVDGDGTAAYYDIEIASAGTLAVVISTQVGGSYGTIDVSALPAGHIYVITLRSSLGNTFEGYFET